MHPILLSLAVVLAGSVGAIAAHAGGYSFRNPFHPEQCGRAVERAKNLLAAEPTDFRARLLLAEGWLCQGLDDNPRALDVAISLLRQVVAEDPANFFPRLELADALRKRFPLSDETRQRMRQLRRDVETADIGAARDELRRYLDRNLAAMDEHWAIAERWLLKARAIPSATAVERRELTQLVNTLAQSGADGVERARRLLDAYVLIHPSDGSAKLQRAEVLRGTVSQKESYAMYAGVVRQVCPNAAQQPAGAECSLARWRRKQLEGRWDEAPSTRARPQTQ